MPTANTGKQRGTMSGVRARFLVSSIALALTVAAPHDVAAQSKVEQGENAWTAGAAFGAQGNADSALAYFAKALEIGRAEHDSSLMAAALRGSAEVMRTYRACGDSAVALLKSAMAVSIVGDRASAVAMVRLLAERGRVAEARQVQKAAYADVADEVPRTITRESIGFLTTQAAVQRAAGQHVAALASLTSARDIAARLIRGDATDSAPPKTPYAVDYINYWVMYDIGQLRLASQTKGVASATEGKLIMDAVSRASDAPDEGDQRRFPVFRLADRSRIKAWACKLNGDSCTAPVPRPCSK